MGSPRSIKYFSEVILLTKSVYEQELYTWIDWYLNVLKFDHVALFDNESFIDVRGIIDKFQTDKISYTSIVGHPYQRELYSKYLTSTNAQWSITLDDDEYLYFSNKYGDTVKDFIECLNEAYHNNMYYIMWTNMLSKEPLSKYNDKLINTHTYYSYEAFNKIKQIPFNKNNLGKCFINNDYNYRYLACDGKHAGHIPECINGNNYAILVNDGSHAKEIINGLDFNSDCFIAHYQLKNRQEWIRKSTSPIASTKAFRPTFIKPVYDMIYKYKDIFIECNLLKDKYEQYLNGK